MSGHRPERIIVASNRAPVTFSRDESGRRIHSRGAGGLVTALNAVVRRSEDAVWVASAASEEDVEMARQQGGSPLEVEGLRVAFVEHDPRAYDLMYNHIANPLLWFVAHGLYNLPYSPLLGERTRRAWEDGYLSVNRNFARAIARVASKEKAPVVMLHDYQLYMAPGMVREELGEEAFISLFAHIPWPEPESLFILPAYIREQMLRSLLEADVVAFHTRRYARNFLETVAELRGVEVDFRRGIAFAGREVRVRDYPISIDPREFRGLAVSERVLSEETFVKSIPGRLLLRVDRMDLSKNIVRGFLAYGRMLELYPHMAGEVTFLAQLQPSRGGIREYAEYAREIERVVGEVNARHGVDGWQPVLLSMQDNFPRSVAAYKHYDALLVNAVRDGMNLVAKEAAVVNEKDGVLILSRTAGAYEELGENALTVNPFDIDEQAHAIYEALTMPADKRAQRATALRETVLSNTIEDWVEAQMCDIAAFREG